MANPSGRRGTAGETERVNYMRSRGWHYSTRIPKKGARDCGDMILDQAVPVMIESKQTKAFTPSSTLSEVLVQIENAKAEFGFAIVKKRGTTDVGKYYALTSVEQMMNLIERVWQPSTPQARRGAQNSICGVYDEYGQCDLPPNHEGDHEDSMEHRAFSVSLQHKAKTFTRR